MQAFVNNAFLDRRRKYAKWGNYIGFGALFAGLFTATRSPVLSSTLLLVGLLGASIGSYMANRYIREPRADQQLAHAMDSLDKRYTLLSYYLPADQVVFSHRGFTVLEVRPQEGLISYANGRWNHKAGFRKIMQLFGEPALGSPHKDLASLMASMKEWASTLAVDGEIPINGAVVFTGARAELQIEGLGYPAVTANEVANVFRNGFGEQAPLSTSQRREIESKLDALVGKA
ncbi:MAG: hypothetical protein ACYCYF_02110 [Anaerolineae bacterium]